MAMIIGGFAAALLLIFVLFKLIFSGMSRPSASDSYEVPDLLGYTVEEAMRLPEVTYLSLVGKVLLFVFPLAPLALAVWFLSPERKISPKVLALTLAAWAVFGAGVGVGADEPLQWILALPGSEMLPKPLVREFHSLSVPPK